MSRKSKAAAIRTLLANGIDIAAIMALVKCKRTYVQQVIREAMQHRTNIYVLESIVRNRGRFSPRSMRSRSKGSAMKRRHDLQRESLKRAFRAGSRTRPGCEKGFGRI